MVVKFIQFQVVTMQWIEIKDGLELSNHNLLLKNEGKNTDDLIGELESNYLKGITDEFIPPLVNTISNQPVAKIEENDIVIFFNFRTDRGRQLTQSLTQKSYPKFKINPIKLYFLTLTKYDSLFKKI